MNHVILFNSPYFKIITGLFQNSVKKRKRKKEKVLKQQFSVLDSMSTGGRGQYLNI